MSRRDVIVVASVSCIYGHGNPENFLKMEFELKVGDRISRRDILERLVASQYERNEMELAPGRFRVKGDTIDLVPGYFNDIVRIELFGDEVDRISEIDQQIDALVRELLGLTGHNRTAVTVQIYHISYLGFIWRSNWVSHPSL